MKLYLLAAAYTISSCSGGTFVGTSWKNQPANEEIPASQDLEKGSIEQVAEEKNNQESGEQKEEMIPDSTSPDQTVEKTTPQAAGSEVGPESVVVSEEQVPENLNRGNEDQSSQLTEIPALDPEKVLNLCAGREQKTLSETIQYEEVQECVFDGEYKDESEKVPGNLSRLDAHLQARTVQLVTVNLPENAVLCGLEVRSISNKIRYDDFMIFTLNDYLLMLSNNELLREMPKKNELYHWDFEQIKGKSYGFEGARYCLGNDSECTLPGHDQTGSVKFSVGTESVANLASLLEGESAYNFRVITTGDNDNSDCWHTGLNLDVSLKYVLP